VENDLKLYCDKCQDWAVECCCEQQKHITNLEIALGAHKAAIRELIKIVPDKEHHIVLAAKILTEV